MNWPAMNERALNGIDREDKAVDAMDMKDGMTELVRGQEDKLLERLTPVVRDQSVTLDLAKVERIDAAGITALITLYRLASEAGHSFAVANASPRVEEILGLVGLERILASQNAEEAAGASLRLALSAA
jgi:anti-anti-sigma factor